MFFSKKKWGLAVLSVCCCSLLGAGLATVNASATQLNTQMLISSDAETIVSASANGVTVTSDDAYEAFINGVFDMDENVGIDFDWAMSNTKTTGKVIFRLTDATNDANYVDVVLHNHSYNNKWTSQAITNATNAGYDVSQYTTSDSRYRNGASYVQWGNEIRSSKPNGQAIYNSISTGDQPAFPRFNVDPLLEETEKDGTIQLLWDKDGSGKDVLTVTVAGDNNGIIQRVRARFDGTYNTNETDNGFVYDSTTLSNCRWGLPYIDFSGGYTISVISETSTDVELKKITVGGDVTYTYQSNSGNTLHRSATLIANGDEYDLTQATLEEPTFYQNYYNYPFIKAQEHTAFDNVCVGAKIVIPSATWTSLSSTTPQNVEKIYLRFANNETEITAGTEYTLSQAGEYALIYEQNGRRAKEVFTVVDFESIKLADALSVTGATSAVGRDDYNNAGYKIVAEKGTAYNAEFFGTFYDEVDIKFAIPASYPDKDSAGEKLNFVVSDLDGNEVFRVVYTTSGQYTTAYVEYGKEIRSYGYGNSSIGWGRHYWYQAPTADQNLVAPDMGRAGVVNERVGIPSFLQLAWAGDVLKVNVELLHNSREKITIAEFDGSYDKDFVPPNIGVINEADFQSWNLPTLKNLQNGYKVAVSCDNRWAGVPVTILSVNGVNLYGLEYMQTQYDFKAVFDDSVYIDGDDVYIPQGIPFPEIYGEYSIMLADNWGIKQQERFTETVDTSTIDEKSLQISSDLYEDRWKSITKNYTVHIEEPRVLTFDVDGGIPIAPITYSQNTLSRIVIQDAVRPCWSFSGWYVDEACTTEFDGDVSAFASTNSTLYAKWTDNDAPVVRLSSTVQSSVVAVKGKSVTLSKSDVVAEDSAQNDTVTVLISVRLPSGSEQSVTDGSAFALTEKGDYIITYTAMDAAGHTATVSRTIIAIERLAPTMNVSENYITTGYEGEKITLANVMAVDQDGNALTPSVYVTFEDELIAVETNAFVAGERGIYKVVFVAKDEKDVYALFEYQIKIQKDVIPPTITTNFADQTVSIGTTIKIPKTSVADNVETGTTLVCKVYYGTEEIVVENNAFVAGKMGVYRVVFTATDAYGNVTEKVVQITANDISENGTNGNVIWIVLGVTGGLAVIGATVTAWIIIKKKKNKREVKENEKQN